MNELMDIIDKLEELQEAEQEYLVLASGSGQNCTLIMLMHRKRADLIKKLCDMSRG